MAASVTPDVRSGGTSTGRRFILQRTLGEGAFGSVYLAEMEGQGGFRRKVALKLLNANWDPASDAGRRLRDEARLLGRLQHRHIVRVDDLVQVDGRWALVMEYIGGADLEVVFTLCKAQNRSIPPRAVAELGAAVAAALVAAWSSPAEDGQPLKVVHRDIKPSNVRVSESGDVKVLDFGVARAEFEGREARTERVRYGSLGYMAPERLLGEPEVPAGDVYALGVMLYELATLDTFGRAELAPDKQVDQVARATAALRERLGEEGEAFVGLVARCLAYRADARPGAAELEATLKAAARALPGNDVHQFTQATFPLLGITATAPPDPVAGRVLEEITGVVDPATAPRPFTTGPHTTKGVASGTLVLPADAAEPLDAPPPGRSRLPLVAGIVAAVGGVIAGVFVATGPHAPPAAVPAEPLPAPAAAPVPAPVLPAASPPVVAAPTEAPPAAVPSAAAAPGPSSTRTATPPRSATSAVSPAPAAPVATPTATVPPPESAAPAAPRLRAAKFTLTGAEGIEVVCGDVRGSGATSALLREFPAGSCAVTAAGSHHTTVTVDSPRGVSCAVEGDTLTCR